MRDLIDALWAELRGRDISGVTALYPGANQVIEADYPPGKLTIAVYPSCFYVQAPSWGARFYRDRAAGWLVGLEYEPDDLIPRLLYRTRGPWADDPQLEAAWDLAVTRHDGMFARKPAKQGKKEGPKQVAPVKDLPYVPLERSA